MTAEREPCGGLPRLAFKIRTGGPRWIVRRLAAEFNLPSTRLGKVVHAALRGTITTGLALPRALRRAATPTPAESARTLYAFYDLGVAPVTFDFLWFLAGAELRRRRLGLDRIRVIIVPGSRRERADYDTVVDAAQRRQRVDGILAPCCALLPACAGVTLAVSRREARRLRSVVARHVYPTGYEPALPTYLGPRECLQAAAKGERGIGALRSTPEGSRRIEAWLAARSMGRKVVTITLRGYGYMPARNSNLAAWLAFARHLARGGYFPVFVPDTAQVISGPPEALAGFAVCAEAAESVELRMALYQSAYLNLGVNNGPMGLCWLNETTRYITCKMETASVPQTTKEYFRVLGFEPGRSLPFATSWQQWLWEDDTFPAIERAFDAMVVRIEGAQVHADPDQERERLPPAPRGPGQS